MKNWYREWAVHLADFVFALTPKMTHTVQEGKPVSHSTYTCNIILWKEAAQLHFSMSNSIIYDLVTLFTQQNNVQINLITHCMCFNKWNYWCYSFKKCFQLLNYKTGLSLFISTLESAKVPMSVTQLSGFQRLLIKTSNTRHWNYPFGYQPVSFWSASQKKLQYQYQSIMPDNNNFVSGI